MKTRIIVTVTTECGVCGKGRNAIETIMSPHIGAAIPAQIKTEMRAQFRDRIKPTPLNAPQTARANQTTRTTIIIARRPGMIASGFGCENVSSSPIVAIMRPIAVTTLPRMAMTPEAITAIDRCSELFIVATHNR